MKVFSIIVSIICVGFDFTLIYCVSNGNINRALACVLCLFISAVGMFSAYMAGQMEVYERVDKWMVPEKVNSKGKHQ